MAGRPAMGLGRVAVAVRPSRRGSSSLRIMAITAATWPWGRLSAYETSVSAEPPCPRPVEISGY